MARVNKNDQQKTNNDTCRKPGFSITSHLEQLEQLVKERDKTQLMVLPQD